MNKPMFKKVRDTEFFKQLPNWTKPFIRGGYAGNVIPVSTTGWIVTLVIIVSVVIFIWFIR